jgi:hypothetical protein
MEQNLKSHSAEYVKRIAKNIKNELRIPHHEALEAAAKQCGFVNWAHFCNTKKSHSSKIVVNEKISNSAPAAFGLSFTQWLAKHQKRDSPLGDLARDAASDPTWPDAPEKKKYIDYLEKINASYGAIDALHSAWRSYKNYVKRKNDGTRKKQPI